MLDLFEMAPTFDDPIGMLEACHRRIERALDAIERVAAHEQEGALDHEAREALRQILCYFSTGVPRHAADEEQSLFPRLRAALDRGPTPGPVRPPSGRRFPRPDAALLRTLETLECEHAAAEAAHQEIDVLGEELLRTGRFEKPEDRARFNELIATLRQLYQEHIHIEDTELFPLAGKVVAPPEQDRIGTEMAARRGIDRTQHRALVAALESRPWSRRT